jgi:hypothetical protein
MPFAGSCWVRPGHGGGTSGNRAHCGEWCGRVRSEKQDWPCLGGFSGTNQGQGVGLSNGFALDRVYADVMKQPEFIEELWGCYLEST